MLRDTRVIEGCTLLEDEDVFHSASLRFLGRHCLCIFPSIHWCQARRSIEPAIILCIYIDNLLLRLSNSGVGYYIGTNLIGALAYADDIVLLSPTPAAARKLLSICETYAADYDIKFNAQKSKLLVALLNNRHRQTSHLRTCSSFSIDGSPIELRSYHYFYTVFQKSSPFCFLQ